MNMLTMHKNVATALRNNGHVCNNWSLHFDKFVEKHPRGKGTQLTQVCKSYDKSSDIIYRALEQRFALFQTMRDEYGNDFRLLYFRNTSRLVVQMARSSILENTGMSFEQITGLPIINGTALKGAVSTWAIWEANGDNMFILTTDKKGKEKADINDDRAKLGDPALVEIFGDNSGVGGNACAGKVVFYGLFPLDAPRLGIDILTPHQNKVLPNEFLVIEPGTPWLCPLRLMRDADASILARAEQLTADCLTTTGLGAKTASGYGRFEKISESTETMQKLQNKYCELQAVATQTTEENRQALATQQKLAELEANEAGMARYATMNDQEFTTFVNQFQHEEGMAGSQWPGTLQEQYDLFHYCTGEGNTRCSGKKQKKAVKNLAVKFGELQNE